MSGWGFSFDIWVIIHTFTYFPTQLSKNTKADAMVKDLYVENAQLLKALEATEQRQKTAERKNYLLEEKIANLNRIVKNLASPSFSPASEIRS